MTRIFVEKAKLSDIDQLTDLSIRSKAYWGYSDEFMQNCRAELTITAEEFEQSGLYYKLVASNKIVGFYGLEKLSTTMFELDRLYVDPNHIGKGFGKKLIDHAKETVSQLQGNELIVQSDPHALKFYEAAGGIVNGEKESESIPGRFLPTLKFEI